MARRRVAEREIHAAVLDDHPIDAEGGQRRLARRGSRRDEPPVLGRGQGTDADVAQPDRADLEAAGEQHRQRVGRRQLPRVDARPAGELQENVVRPEAGDQRAADATDRDACIRRLDEGGSDPLPELTFSGGCPHGDDEDDEGEAHQQENAGDQTHEASDEPQRRHVRRCLPPPDTPATRNRRLAC